MLAGLLIRELCLADYAHNFLACLAGLTTVGAVSRDTFEAHLNRRTAMGVYTAVVVEKATQAVVGTASLITVPVFIHGASCKGFIEDVVVDEAYRGCGVGRMLINHIVAEGRRRGCYKLVLSCKRDNVVFYEKSGFKEEETSMAMRFASTTS